MKYSHFLVSPGILHGVGHSILVLLVFLTANLAFFYFPNVASAQENCGDITSINPYSGQITEVAVADCTDPFEPNIDVPENFELAVDGVLVPAGASTVAVPNDFFRSVQNNFSSPPNDFFGYRLQLFEQQGIDYTEINLRPPSYRDIDPAEILPFLEAHFADDPDLPLYREAVITDDFGDLTYSQQNILYDYLFNLMQTEFAAEIPLGEYWLVFTEEVICVLQNPATDSWFGTALALIIPTAHAQSFDRCLLGYIPRRFVIGLEITQADQQPRGASSVLFLPGIQASRLYTDGILGTENQLWEPNRDNDVEKLAMNSSGQSINDVYTNDVLDKIFGLFNIYDGLLDLLADLKADDAIVDYLPFAYDWRYDVFDVVTKPVKYKDGEEKLLAEEVKRLAAESHTGKVTIIGHSNGGLVAKALLHEYGETELAGLVDKVVMVGTPQLGTPKAVGSLLHGLDQSKLFGILVSQRTARGAIQFMPGAYGLLPSKTYFETATDEMITNDGSAIATPVSSYGDLNNHDNFIEFLFDKNGTRNEVTNLTQPVTLNENILNKTISNQIILDNWVAPAGVSVYEAAGIGLATIDGFYYREFSCKDNPTCILIPFLKPVPKFTLSGDGTVVLRSATAYEEAKTKYTINLTDETFIGSKNHANITESESVKSFLKSLVLYPYLTDTIVGSEFGQFTTTYTIIGVHSPVSILVKNSDGQEVGVINGEIKEDIDSSSYFEFAGSKYVIVPDTEDIEVILSGEAAGRYSLTIEELTFDGGQSLLQEVMGATSTSEMQVSFGCQSGSCGELTVDYDGDGELDVKFNWSGDYVPLNQSVVAEEVEETISSSASRSTGTRVREPAIPAGQVAGVTTSIPEADLISMWNQLLEIKSLLDELEVSILNK